MVGAQGSRLENAFRKVSIARTFTHVSQIYVTSAVRRIDKSYTLILLEQARFIRMSSSLSLNYSYS